MATYSFHYVSGADTEAWFSIKGPRGEIATAPIYDDAKEITDALNMAERTIIMYCPSCKKPSTQMPAFLCPHCGLQSDEDKQDA